MPNHAARRHNKGAKVLDQEILAKVFFDLRTMSNRLKLLFVTAIFVVDGQIRLVAGIRKPDDDAIKDRKFVLLRTSGETPETVEPINSTDAAIMHMDKIVACCMAGDGKIAYAYEVGSEGRTRICPHLGSNPADHYDVSGRVATMQFVGNELKVWGVGAVELSRVEPERYVVGGSGNRYPRAI